MLTKQQFIERFCILNLPKFENFHKKTRRQKRVFL